MGNRYERLSDFKILKPETRLYTTRQQQATENQYNRPACSDSINNITDRIVGSLKKNLFTS